jgi:transcriptional regulator with XRE-family HTH domain
MNVALKNSPKNAVQWTRETLGLSQLELAQLIGMSIFSIQSVETNRMRVSQRFACRMSEETGMDAQFLTNKLDPNHTPDPAVVRKQFERAQKGMWRGIYKARLLPQMAVLRSAYFQIMLAQKHGGYAACQRSGFLDQLGRASLKLVDSLQDPKEQREFYKIMRKEMLEGGSNEKILNFLASLIQELRQGIKEKQIKQ